MLVKKAYAKINLALEVMESEGGYHKVNNLMIPIDIFDEITLEKNDEIIIENDPFPGENIMERAAKVFFKTTGIEGGVYLTIRKNIPHAAGLAGGSTDAACVLCGLNELYDAKASNEELIQMASLLGSDVGFFIEGKTALCTGRGEIVNVLDITTPRIPVFLMKPDTGLSTALVYKNYVYEPVSRKKQIESIIQGINDNDTLLVKDNIFNDLSNVALRLNEKLRNLYNELISKGLHPYISGSGPTMYLFAPKEEEIKLAESILDDSVFRILCHTK